MLTESQLDALRAQHGRIKYVIYNGLEIVFRKPTRAETQQYMMAGDDPAGKASRDDTLSRLIVVVPPREEYAKFLDEYPLAALSKPIGNAIAQLSGIAADDDAKPWGSASMPNGTLPSSTPAG